MHAALQRALQRTLHSLEKDTSLMTNCRVTCAAGAKRRYVESKWTNNNTSWPLPMQPGQLQNMRKESEIGFDFVFFVLWRDTEAASPLHNDLGFQKRDESIEALRRVGAAKQRLQRARAERAVIVEP
jgi:hypothetical protein